MTAGHSLIDAAVKVCGSRYKVAQRLDISQATLSLIYSGKRDLPPKMAGKLADLAGLNPQEAAVVALIEGEKDPREREALKRVFFRAGAAAMLALCIAVPSLAPSPAMAGARESTDSTGALCILCQLARHLLNWLATRTRCAGQTAAAPAQARPSPRQRRAPKPGTTSPAAAPALPAPA